MEFGDITELYKADHLAYANKASICSKIWTVVTVPSYFFSILVDVGNEGGFDKNIGLILSLDLLSLVSIGLTMYYEYKSRYYAKRYNIYINRIFLKAPVEGDLYK